MANINTLTLGNPAETQHPIHEFFRERWSPRAFAERPVEREKLRSLFEAARWAPSAGNKQPWSFIFATQEDPEAHARIVAGLKESNAIWARQAPVLILTLASLYPYPGKEHVSFYDLGSATGNLLAQATALGLATHPMGGFEPQQLHEALHIPAEQEILTVIALGYPGSIETLPEDLREREVAARQRKAQEEFVFEGTWPDQQ